jgi:hypothetical protein
VNLLQRKRLQGHCLESAPRYNVAMLARPL